MIEILHAELPGDLVESAALPGVRPLTDGQWLRVDDVYAAQVSYRRRLLSKRRGQVLFQNSDADDAVTEVFEEALSLMARQGFSVGPRTIQCPDGVILNRDPADALAVLGRALQEDICILQKCGQEHVLKAAILCFPASWMLSEKAGRPLSAIHSPVENYDAGIAARVQRLFDGVQAGRPLWRNNMLWYDDPDLFQPLSEVDPARQAPSPSKARYRRAERQSIVRMPKSKAVVFSIHSYVVRV